MTDRGKELKKKDKVSELSESEEYRRERTKSSRSIENWLKEEENQINGCWEIRKRRCWHFSVVKKIQRLSEENKEKERRGKGGCQRGC